MRSVSHQMHMAKFPCTATWRASTSRLAGGQAGRATGQLAFTEQAHNVVLVGGPGTGKTHLATAIGVAGITRHGKRVRFYSTVDLVNALEQEKAEGKPGASQRACCAWTWSSSMSWATCPSARQAAPCCSTC
jgi:hypothetical protein